jgi:hypothetical protein
VSFEEKVSAADFAFRLFVREMMDEDNPIALRLECGREIMNRSWGKPRQAVEMTGKGREPLKIQIYNADDPTAPSKASSGTIYLPDNGRDPRDKTP